MNVEHQTLASSWFRGVVLALGLLLVWQGIVWATQAPHYILPAPTRVLAALTNHFALLMSNAWITLAEILLGLTLGIAAGLVSAIVMARYRRLRGWLMPVLVVSQALPVFALAPVLVLWFGYGFASKVAMAVLIIYFPVTAACYHGLRETNPGWIDLAQTMGATPSAIMRHIRLPAALPAIASGTRIAAAVAPIGAVVGEWVGASHGLGHLMLYANGRMQIDLMFAALLVLAVLALSVYFSIDRLLDRLLYWQPKST
jgi:putative hydroxymethylpyrimidine transport system permease protein